jgi:hypothetical protein
VNMCSFIGLGGGTLYDVASVRARISHKLLKRQAFL